MHATKDWDVVKEIVGLIQARVKENGDEVGQILCMTLLNLIDLLKGSNGDEREGGFNYGRQQRKVPEWARIALELRKQGLGWGEISKRLGVPKTTVRDWCKRLLEGEKDEGTSGIWEKLASMTRG